MKSIFTSNIHVYVSSYYVYRFLYKEDHHFINLQLQINIV